MKRLLGRLGWRGILAIWLSLLTASSAVRWLTPGPVAPPGLQRSTLLTMTDDGPIDGPPMRVAWYATGSVGTPVLLLHGSPGSGADLRPLAEALAPRRVVVPDLPGFGYSSQWLPDYSQAAHARAMAALCDDLQLDSVHVVGFSMGGGVATRLAHLMPDRVASLTLLAGTVSEYGEGTGDHHAEQIKYALAGGLLAALELLPHFGLVPGSLAGRHAFVRNFWDTDQRDGAALLARSPAPVLVVNGVHDPLVPAWAARHHAALAPQAELVLLDANHFLPFGGAVTERVASVIEDFVTRQESGALRPGLVTVEAGRFQPVVDGVWEPVVDPRGRPWALAGSIAAASLVHETLATSEAARWRLSAHADPVWMLLWLFVASWLRDGIAFAIGRNALRPFPERLVPGEPRRGQRRRILLARFLPGARLPITLLLGREGCPWGRWLGWSLLAQLLWWPPVWMLTLLAYRYLAPMWPLLAVLPLVAGIPCWYALLRRQRFASHSLA